MKAKAMSYVYQYHDCPVVGPLAHFVLMSLAGVSMTDYEATDYMQDLVLKESASYDFQRKPEIDPSTRVLMEEVFNLKVQDQEMIEEFLRRQLVLRPRDKRTEKLDLEQLERYYDWTNEHWCQKESEISDVVSSECLRCHPANEKFKRPSVTLSDQPLALNALSDHDFA
jgi:hypothetical protein